MKIFLIGGVLFLLNRLERYLNRPEMKLRIPLEDFLGDITKWLREMYPTKRKFPSIVLSCRKSSLAGEYNYYSNEITIYLRNNRTLSSLVETQIHETIHHIFIDTKTKERLYQRQMEEFGYWDHPGEILSFSMSKPLAERYMRSRFNRKWLRI